MPVPVPVPVMCIIHRAKNIRALDVILEYLWTRCGTKFITQSDTETDREKQNFNKLK